jgi:glycosyltransferase involved in cell wall biosynthesis
MASFRQNFEIGLTRRGIRVSPNPEDGCDAILVIGGTRSILPLWRARRRGTRIVQRLDGINWIHRRRNTGPRHFLRAEYGNLLLSLIRSRIATHILYQSKFTHRWWDDWYGKRDTPWSMVHNGVNLEEFRPEGPGGMPEDRCRLLVVEGSLGGGYGTGLDNALQLGEILHRKHGLQIELVVAGNITHSHQADVQSRASIPIVWAGALPRARIPELDRSAQLLFSADLNPACPNSVIEALACGLPVVAFDTGALSELVIGNSGRLVPYGGDPWQLQKPDVPALAEAASEVLRNRPRFSNAARAHAEKALDVESMVEGYLRALLEA